MSDQDGVSVCPKLALLLRLNEFLSQFEDDYVKRRKVDEQKWEFDVCEAVCGNEFEIPAG